MNKLFKGKLKTFNYYALVNALRRKRPRYSIRRTDQLSPFPKAIFARYIKGLHLSTDMIQKMDTCYLNSLGHSPYLHVFVQFLMQED